MRPSRVGAAPGGRGRLVEQRDEGAVPPSAVASVIGYVIEQPEGVDVGEIVIRPTVQA